MFQSPEWKIEGCKKYESNDKGCIKQTRNRWWSFLFENSKNQDPGRDKKDKKCKDKTNDTKFRDDPDPFVMRIAVCIVFKNMIRIGWIFDRWNTDLPVP